MKKILALIIAAATLISLNACAKKEKPADNLSAPVADSATVDVVNNAYTNTASVISESETISFKHNLKKTVTVDEDANSQSISSKIAYKTAEKGKIISYETAIRSGEETELCQIYDDTQNVYGFKAGTNYLLEKNNSLNKFLESISQSVQIFDGKNIKVLDTKIFNTDSKGYGFVLTYDFNDKNFHPDMIFGMLYNEVQNGLDIEPKELRISGIIDSEGKLLQEKITYIYSYKFTEDEVLEDVDPDNSNSSGTTQKVEKTANVDLSVEIDLSYGISEISVPDSIKVLDKLDKNDKKPMEISLSDFKELTSKKKQTKK